MNGVLINPSGFEGRNPYDIPMQLPPWQTLSDDDIICGWPGSPNGLNVPTRVPRQKGDEYRSGQHYRSRHNPTVAPTASTLALTGTHCPGVTNIAGEAKLAARSPRGGWGPPTAAPRVPRLPAAGDFLHCNDKHPPLPSPTRFHYANEGQRRPRPPPAAGAAPPLLPLHRTDFVLQNKVDCILLSPVVVPVVDPVTDYAEDTQRRRHSDDDALPNVGEEDY